MVISPGRPRDYFYQVFHLAVQICETFGSVRVVPRADMTILTRSTHHKQSTGWPMLHCFHIIVTVDSWKFPAAVPLG